MRDGFAARLRDRGPRALDVFARAADSAAMPPIDHNIRPRVIFGVATALGFFSGFQAYYFVSSFTERPASFPLLLALNLSYWYSWAILTPGILWLAQRFSFERRSWKLAALVHAGGVFLSTLLHVGLTVASRMGIFAVIGQSSGSWQSEAQRMFFLI